jgi:hypothetical protein
MIAAPDLSRALVLGEDVVDHVGGDVEIVIIPSKTHPAGEIVISLPGLRRERGMLLSGQLTQHAAVGPFIEIAVDDGAWVCNKGDDDRLGGDGCRDDQQC